MDYIWLLVLAGGAALLGVVLLFGMFSRQPRKAAGLSAFALAVVALAVWLGVYVAMSPTAPTVASDPAHSEEQRPAAPTRTEDLPGQN